MTASRVGRVAIVQSNYIPWKGYFDLIAGVDTFVLYDDVQYTRRDWRNRNRIKTAQGAQWLTIPVQVSGRYHQAIRDVAVDEPTWAETHWRTIVHHYRKAPAFAHHAPALERLYGTVPGNLLSGINRHFLEGICALLEIRTPLRSSSEFALEGDATGRLIGMCAQLGATTYVSGPSARDYLDEARFAAAGIAVEWARYDGYREYRQLYPPFDHYVSIVDLLLNEGAAAREFLRCA
jgi:hypothetical protein